MRWVWIDPKYAGLIAAMQRAEAAAGKGRHGVSPWRTRSFLMPPNR